MYFENYYEYEKIEGADRKKVEKIPEAAFREAICECPDPPCMGCGNANQDFDV